MESRVKKLEFQGDEFYYLVFEKDSQECKIFLGEKVPEDQELKKLIEQENNNFKKEKNIISILEKIQSKYDYLPKEEIIKASIENDISAAEIYAVATFYSVFKLVPPSKYLVKVCDGTACHVRGSVKILETLKKELEINEKTNISKDNLFCLETVRCLGLCASAPLMVINEKLYPKLTEDSIKNIIQDLRKKND